MGARSSGSHFLKIALKTLNLRAFKFWLGAKGPGYHPLKLILELFSTILKGVLLDVLNNLKPFYNTRFFRQYWTILYCI